MVARLIMRGLALAALCAASSLRAQAPAAVAGPVLDPAALMARVEQDVVRLRGLPFKQSVPMEKQTPEGLAQHLDKAMEHTVPESVAAHFDRIISRVGLYRGPPLGDFRAMVRTVMTTQAAAYYDTDTRRIYILDEGGTELETGLIYAHELYHGLQDQYFDLAAYQAEELELDSDQSLARQAVVEGEATLLHTLWVMQRMTGGVPARQLVAPAIQMQANLDFEQMRAMVGGTSPEKVAEIDAVPPFIMETLLGNYLKGAAFVFAVQERGWEEVEKLYREYPPQSTEQILHPQKWFAREGAARITWPDLARERALRNWEVIDDDVIGEIQWRIIFGVHGLRAQGVEAAAGWDGDRYAVLRDKRTDETLLLLRTAWDDEAEATQFASAYRQLLAVKYRGSTDVGHVEQQGRDVFIVEGAPKLDAKALLKIVRAAKKTHD